MDNTDEQYRWFAAVANLGKYFVMKQLKREMKVA